MREASAEIIEEASLWRDDPGDFGMGTAAAAMAAVVVAALFALPSLYAACLGADFATLANESIAYRFGHVHRLATGDPAGIWLPQGYTLSLLQRGLYSLVSASVVETDLRSALNRFALMTAGLSALLVSALVLMIAKDRWLPRGAKLWICLVAILPVYGFTTAGVGYALSADYYQLDVVLIAAAVYLLLAGMARLEVPIDSLSAAALGAFAGAAAANKISILPVASLPLIPMALRAWAHAGRPPAILVASGCGACGAFLLIHASYFSLEWGELVRALVSWWAFASSSSGEPGFWETSFLQHAVRYNYRYAAVFFGLALLVSAASAIVWWVRVSAHISGSVPEQRRRIFRWAASLLATCGIVGVGLVAAWSLWRRPAGTTFYEIACVAIGLGGALLGLYAHVPFGRWAGAALASGWLLTVGMTFDAAWAHNMLHDSAQRGALGWSLHEHLKGFGKPVIVVIDDDGFAARSVEKLLLKAFSDFPTWDMSTGREELWRLAPLSFRTRQSSHGPEGPYPHSFVLAEYVRLDLEGTRPISAQLEALKLRSGVTCERWILDSFNAVDVCDVP